ncbi:FecR domain-containing protein, partial [Candidatus Gracilibacteria bacterium]|nr:FecR domain-containing protein [Candidatus Gracilibacteria bacterium]
MKKILFVAIVLIAFVFMTVGNDFFSSKLMPNILAEIQVPTHLEIGKGVVLVNGKIAENKIILEAGDVIEVQSNAFANIIFFDNSVSRLSSDTKITIAEISGDDSASAGSRVKLKLDLGEVWSKVTKLINNESTFSVATADIVASVRGSAFNVKVSEIGNTSVMATEHSLLLEKVKTADFQKEESVVIIEGQKATSYPRVKRATFPTTTEQSSIRFKVEKITTEEKKERWFRKNQKADELHEIRIQRRIENAQENAVGTLPGTVAYKVKDIRDKISLVATQDPEKRVEMKIEIAERKILEAQVLIRNGRAEQTEKLLDEAEELLFQVAKTRDETADSQLKIELNKKILSVITKLKQMTNLIVAYDRDYRIKEFLYEVEVVVASEDTKEEIKKEQYQQRIIESFDLAKSKNNESISEVVEKLARDIKSDFTALDETKKISEDNLNDLIADPYLNAVMRKIETVETEYAPTKIVDLAAVEEVVVEEAEAIKAWLELKTAEAEYKAAAIQTKNLSEENKESYFFEADDINGRIEIDNKINELIETETATAAESAATTAATAIAETEAALAEAEAKAMAEMTEA